MIKVIVVDDHAVVREGLKRIISENMGMTVTGEAGDGNEALRVIQTAPCDVVLLDITMPEKNGLDVLKQLHADKPRLPVLVLSMHAEDQYAIRMLRAGAAGYLTKESAPAKLVQAIRKVVRGGKYVSTTLAEKLAVDLDDNSKKTPHELLSDREYQVLCMIASGKTVTEAANDLALSVKTISTYRVRILEKLKMKHNADLTRYAIKQGLVD
jgi:two-component system, NarL family, invasion response regulator UvrY